jgi:mRNA interferase MazF
MFNYKVEDMFKIKKLTEPDIQIMIEPNVLKKPLLGSIYMVDLGKQKNNSVQSGIRPCIILNNYEHCGEIERSLIIPLTSKRKTTLPVHTTIQASRLNGLKMNSTALAEQLTTINNNRLLNPLGILSFEDFMKVYTIYKKSTPLHEFLPVGEWEKVELPMIEGWKVYFASVILVVGMHKNGQLPV